MIRIIQRRFIFTAMTAVTVLLAVLIGTLNAANAGITVRQMNRRLQMLADNERKLMRNMGRDGEQAEDFPAGQEPKPGNFWNPPIDEDTAMSLRFFVVHIDADGGVLYTDISRISSVTAKEAQAYAQKAADKEKKTGYMGDFKYLSVTAEDGVTAFLFLDISGQAHTMLVVGILSAGVAVICWLGMLLLVVLLSRRAIRPIAQNMERQKQFVTDAGHELKTPLAIILTNLDAMELINGENKWSKNIRMQAKRLNGLMQNLLTLAKMDEAGAEVPMSDLVISQLAAETLQPFLEPAAWKGIRVESDIEPDVLLFANQEYMQRLLSILLDNAVKYANQNGWIAVSLHKSEKAVILQVKNTCAQLPEAAADKLFDRFYRGDSARTQKNGGYGIGLSAARALVEAQKGKISAKYENGDTVVFTARFG